MSYDDDKHDDEWSRPQKSPFIRSRSRTNTNGSSKDYFTSSAVQPKRRISRRLVLVLGILLGFIVSRLTSSSSSSWLSPTLLTRTRPRTSPSHSQDPRLKSHQHSRNPIPLPTIAQRRRVLDLLTHLSPHHTKTCTRDAQPLYVQQVLERYAPLVGHLPPPSPSWWGRLPPFSWFSSSSSPGQGQGQEERVETVKGPTGLTLVPSNHKYFFAINLYNSFPIIPDLFSTLFRVASILGYHNIYISIYENGSSDQTKALLRIFDSLTRSVGIRITIRTSLRTRGAFNHRIEYLAEVRNSALVPLLELRDSENEYFDTVIFMNDVLPCPDDILELLYQSRLNNAGITCAADYMYHTEISSPVFYDNWVARDINGTALENAPFESVFHHGGSQERFMRHLPVQVQSCWNGIAVLDPAPLYGDLSYAKSSGGQGASVQHSGWGASGLGQVRFRMARIVEGECSASECSLICNDYWESGYGRVVMVPRVKLAYDKKVYQIIHPPRLNLTSIRGYVKLGGLPDDPRTDPQDRAWFGPHDRLFVEEESVGVRFVGGPENVWCWGWDGAGDLDGPDVDPVWERMGNGTRGLDAVRVRHERGFVPISQRGGEGVGEGERRR